MNLATEIKQKKQPSLNLLKCTGCDACLDACEKKLIQKQENYDCQKCIKYCRSINIPCKPVHYVFDYENCDACGLCMQACSENAIYWVKIKKQAAQK